MILTTVRKFFNIFRGGSTPAEVTIAITLGMVMGMMPGFSLLHLCLAFVVLLINAPLAPFLISVAVAKLISYPLTYVLYAIGKGVLAVGFLEAIARFFANAPVTAWWDLDRYCTLGGIVLGVVFGIILSILLNRAIKSFRMKMATLEAGSEKYNAFVKKPAVKILAWIFFGKGRKGMTYAEALEKKTRVIRKSGVAVAVVFVAIVFAFEFIFAAPILKHVLQTQLEQANGATVDIASVDLSLFRGHCSIKGIQMCDPDHLDRNLISIGETRTDFGVMDLLKKRFVIDEIGLTDAATDSQRAQAGQRFRQDKPLAEPAPSENKTIYDYLAQAKDWKEKIERWYKTYQQYKPKPGAPPTPEEIQITGYRNMRASYLVDQSPRLTIRKITVNGLVLRNGGTELKLDLNGLDFSSDPKLLGANPTLTFTGGDNLNGAIEFSFKDPGQPHILNLTAKGVSMAAIQKILSGNNAMKFDSGTADIEIKDGKIAMSGMDLPLAVNLTNLKASSNGKGFLNLSPEASKAVADNLTALKTTIDLVGKPYAPYVVFDVKGLLNSFKDVAGAAVKKEIEGQMGKYAPAVPSGAPSLPGGLPSLPGRP